MGAFVLKIKNIQVISVIYIGNIIKANEEYTVQGDLERISLGFDSFFMQHIDDEDKIEIYKDNVLMDDINIIKNLFKQTAESISFDNSLGHLDSINTQQGIDEASLTLYKNNGVVIPDSPYKYLNFGAGLVAAKQDANNARVDLDLGDIWGGFGFTEVSDEDEDMTTSTSWQTKLIMTLNSLPEGKYRIGTYWEWQNSNPLNDFIGQVILDDITELAYQREEISDNSNYVWSPITTFKYIDISTGDHTIKINWKSSESNKSVTIRRARIELWRVGNVTV